MKWMWIWFVMGCSPVSEPESEGDSPGECADGFDNDGDAAIDCDDAGCAFTDECPMEADTDTDSDTSTAGLRRSGWGGLMVI